MQHNQFRFFGKRADPMGSRHGAALAGRSDERAAVMKEELLRALREAERAKLFRLLARITPPPAA
jgi:hypothetical protein